MITVIDYGINNTDQLAESLRYLNVEFKITRNEKDILNSKKVIISDAPDITKAVKKIHLFNLFSLLRIQKKPILGISLGMELLCNKTDNNIACLGLIPLDAKETKLQENLTLEKSNWITVHQLKPTLLFDKIPNDIKFYFDCHYHVDVGDSTVATTNNGKSFSAAVIKNYFYGVQFIPEKSGEYGLQLLRNFIELC